jgi:para-nitrobenzyl esterase
MRPLLLLVLLPLACHSTPAGVVPDAALADAAAAREASPAREGSPAADALAPPACPGLPPADGPELVKTSHATLKGKLVDGTWSFTRVRYAAPPVGPLRFARPAAPSCEPKIVDATLDASSCPQPNLVTGAVMGEEDCLFVNLWVPPHASSERLPVLFFIHGGGNLIGSGTTGTDLGGNLARVYEGGALARGAGAIVVTINYRLGALGFLAHPSLRGADGGSGNWAVHDMIAALGWVRDNIAAFGGDPARVTIFGESAGGLAVCTLLASPLAKGLFHGAVFQSGGCAAPTRDAREKEGLATAAAVSCGSGSADVPACLRKASVADLVKAKLVEPPALQLWHLPYGPNVDGVVLTAPPLAVVSQGKHNAVPLIVGSNLEESALFLLGTVILTCADYEQELAKRFPGVSDKVLAKYPCQPLAPKQSLVAALTACSFTCEARRLARAARGHQSAPVFRYHFRDGLNWGLFQPVGAAHAVELFYLFDSFVKVLYSPSAAEAELGAFMRTSWGSFAARGDPNPPGKSDWPRYEIATDPVLTLSEQLLQAKIGVDKGIVPECDLWDSLVP